MLKLTVVQPPFYAGEQPDAKIAEILLSAMENVAPGEVLVLPEYGNCGGLTDPAAELAALPRAAVLHQAAAHWAGGKGAYIALNVIERRKGQIFNSTWLYGPDGKPAFCYDKVHLPPAEVSLGITPGEGSCVCQVGGLKFGFLTCYDVYFQEQIEYLARQKPDILVIPGYQRGERTDIIRAQAKLAAFRCNAYVARAAYSMGTDEKGGCSMIVAPDGKILADLGAEVGTVSREVDPKWKYLRPAGFGGQPVRNDDFVSNGLRPEVFQNRIAGE